MSDVGVFFAGLLGGVSCMLIILAFGIDVRLPDDMILNKHFDKDNIRYNITIDSTVTDSLFGKTWRK